MAARHPDVRAQHSHHPDARPARSPDTHRPRAHTRDTESESARSSDGDQDAPQVFMTPPHIPTRTATTDHRAQHAAPHRRPSPTYTRPSDETRDTGSDDSSAPRRSSQLSRNPSIAAQARHGPADAARHAQLNQPPESPDDDYGGAMQTHVGWVTEREPSAEAGDECESEDDEETPFRPGTRSEAARGPPEGGRVGTRGSENPNNRASSGTDTPSPQQTPPAMPSSEDPYVPGPGSAMHQQPLPVYQFNRDLYPAYDVHARRIGMEHLRKDTFPSEPRSHYRDRTRNYPAPNVTVDEYPHVMNIELNIAAPSNADKNMDNRRSPPRNSTGSPEPPTEHERSPSVATDIPLHDSPSPIPPDTYQDTFDAAEERTPEAEPERPSENNDADQYPVNSTPYLRAVLGLAPDQAVNLSALADPPEGEKPNYPYPTLIKLAIHGSRNKRLTLQDIYQELEDRFDWYRENANDKSWQNSIRHNLSLNKCFRRVPRPITEPGKGSFWTVDYSQGTGNKRERKRNKKPTKAQLRKMAQEEAARVAAAEARDAAISATLRPVPHHEEDRGAGPSSHGDRTSTGVGSPTECNFYPARPDSRSSLGTPNIAHTMNDAHIDPALRDEGHLVGEGRTRLGQHDFIHRRSSAFLPPVPIRQSARNMTRNDTYHSGRSHSPSPPRSSSSLSRSTHTNPFSGGGRTSSNASLGRPPNHTFGLGSLGVVTQYTVPGPINANWAPYGGGTNNVNVPPPVRPSQSGSSPNNALLLSGVPSSTAGSATYSPVSTASSPPRPEGSRLPVSNFREAPVHAVRRRLNGRRVYTDSRGNVYPAHGDTYSSGSD